MLILAPFLALTVAHLTCLALGTDWAADVTQVTLMPALGLAFWAMVRERPLARSAPIAPSAQRLTRLTGWALFFSWCGDTVPRFLDGDPAFGAMIGCFLLAQISFIRAFWPWAARSVLHRRRLLAPYVVVAVALIGLCLPEAGVLAPAVVIYGATLTLMGITATGVNALTWIGGVIFMVSDSLIALDAFEVWTQPGHELWVMSTYCLAQLFLVLGVLVLGVLVLGVVGISSGDDAEQPRDYPDVDGARPRDADGARPRLAD